MLRKEQIFLLATGHEPYIALSDKNCNFWNGAAGGCDLQEHVLTADLNLL